MMKAEAAEATGAAVVPEDTDVAAVRIRHLVELAARHFQISKRALTSPRRAGKSMNQIRSLTLLMIRDVTDASYPEIGRNFGWRDHSTVIRAIKIAKAAVEADKKAAKIYSDLMQLAASDPVA